MSKGKPDFRKFAAEAAEFLKKTGELAERFRGFADEIIAEALCDEEPSDANRAPSAEVPAPRTRRISPARSGHNAAMTDPIGFTREDLDRAISGAFSKDPQSAMLRQLRDLLSADPPSGDVVSRAAVREMLERLIENSDGDVDEIYGELAALPSVTPGDKP